jgi:prepilin-type N-terminal cleavage/methylation domain-containing protein
MKKGFTLLELVIVVGALLLFSIMAIPRISDVKDCTKAAKVQRELVDLRLALENFYTTTGTYPDLASEGVKDDLELAREEGLDGKKNNFAQSLGVDKMPETPRTNVLEKNNRVSDLEDFINGDMKGGWNYNYAGKTGEIRANLPENAYGQMINWNNN